MKRNLSDSRKKKQRGDGDADEAPLTPEDLQVPENVQERVIAVRRALI